MEVSIAGHDLTDTVLSHENRGGRVMHYVGVQVRQFGEDLFGNFGMAHGGN